MIVLYIFIAATNYSPVHFIEHANQFRVINRAMKPGDEESKHVLFTGVCCTVSFPLSSCVRDAIRNFPGKGERFLSTPKPPKVSGAHLASCSFLGERRSECEVNHSPHTAKV